MIPKDEEEQLAEKEMEKEEEEKEEKEEQVHGKEEVKRVEFVG